MIPHPAYFAGSLKVQRRRADQVWREVALLIQREAVYRLGEHPYLESANVTWRRLLANADHSELVKFFQLYARTWPARLVRP